MFRIQAIIQNEAGIHCRPAAVIIKTIGDYAGQVVVRHADESSDPRSMLGLMSMCLTQGTAITIEVHGPDEEMWATKLKELFEFHFDFPRP